MIDSELFGYGAGAFTGAKRDGNPGRLAEAHGGTLFLDEIGDMPLALQTRLLRVLESGEVAPLGSAKVQHVDICVIAATNQDLARRVADGGFRQDLFYRLAGLVITLVPLRERQDLPVLAGRILQSLPGGHGATISAAAMERLRQYAWPGNVRELRHVLQRALAIGDGAAITPDDLLLPTEVAAIHAPPPPDPGPTAGGGIMEGAERSAIERTLREAHGDIDGCARRLGISRATLYRKLRLHGIR
jgi:transcriptional regulator of acetoin/glycerol metabolism